MQVKVSGKRSLGCLASGGMMRNLVASSSGNYRIFTSATAIPLHLLAIQGISSTEQEGGQGLVLTFSSRLSLWRFLASEQARGIKVEMECERFFELAKDVLEQWVQRCKIFLDGEQSD